MTLLLTICPIIQHCMRRPLILIRKWKQSPEQDHYYKYLWSICLISYKELCCLNNNHKSMPLLEFIRHDNRNRTFLNLRCYTSLEFLAMLWRFHSMHFVDHEPQEARVLQEYVSILPKLSARNWKYQFQYNLVNLLSSMLKSLFICMSSLKLNPQVIDKLFNELVLFTVIIA